MKLIKHGILLVLALCIFMLGANVILVEAIDDNEISAVSAANQIENYDLKRVLKSKHSDVENGSHYILHYDHKKTGAQFVCFINLDYDNIEISYRVPSENDNGVSHALEHCCFDDMVMDPEDSIDVGLEAYTYELGLTFKVNSFGSNFENIDFLVNSLKNKKILNDESIFKKQVFNQTKGHDGLMLNRGRMFIEMSQNDRVHSVYTDKIYNYEIMNSGNKLKFESGGLPEKIINCSYNEVCDAYNKYIHPSNSLTVIRSKKFKEVMVNLDKNFLNDYDKKNIDVDYRLPERSNSEFFTQYNVREVGGIFFNKNYDYCGIALYPLKGVKNDKISTFKNLCSKINSEQFRRQLSYLGYSDCVARLCESIDYPYLRIAIAGNDSAKFNKDVLLRSFEKILKEVTDISDRSYIDERNGFRNVASDIFMASYALCGDPFSNRFFTIIDNELINYEETPGIDRNLCFEVLKPEKIALLKSDKNITMPENVACRYQLSFADNDKEMIRLAMRILNRGLVSKELQKRGSVYRNMYTKTDLNDERCRCFYSEENVTLDNIADFFKNDFNEQVKNFVVSDELFNLVKNNIINKRSYLEAVDSCEYDEMENVVKEEILDNAYFSEKFEVKRNILQISREEIEKFIRTAKFVGYALVK